MKNHLSLLSFNLVGFLPISSFFLFFFFWLANLSLGEFVEKFELGEFVEKLKFGFKNFYFDSWLCYD